MTDDDDEEEMEDLDALAKGLDRGAPAAAPKAVSAAETGDLQRQESATSGRV